MKKIILLLLITLVSFTNLENKTILANENTICDEKAEINLSLSKPIIVPNNAQEWHTIGAEKIELNPSTFVVEQEGEDITEQFYYYTQGNKLEFTPKEDFEGMVQVSVSDFDGTAYSRQVIFSNKCLRSSGGYQYYRESENKYLMPHSYFQICQVEDVVFYVGNGQNDDIYLYAKDLKLSEDIFDFEDRQERYGESNQRCDIILITPKRLGDAYVTYENESFVYSHKVSMNIPMLFALEGSNVSAEEADLKTALTHVSIRQNEEKQLTLYSYMNGIFTDITNNVTLKNNESGVVNFSSGVLTCSKPFENNENNPYLEWEFTDEYGNKYNYCFSIGYGGGQGYDGLQTRYETNYGDKRLLIGFGNTSSDSNKLHIDDGSSLRANDYPYTMEFILGAAYLDGDGGITEVAPQAIYDCITNVRVSVEDPTNQIRVAEEPTLISTSLGVDTWRLAFKVEPQNSCDNIKLKVTFDLQLPEEANRTITVYHRIWIEGTSEVDVAIPTNYTLTQIKDIFSSKDKFFKFLADNGYSQIDSNSIITINLPGKMYDGQLIVNIQESEFDFRDVVIKGEGLLPDHISYEKLFDFNKTYESNNVRKYTLIGYNKTEFKASLNVEDFQNWQLSIFNPNDPYYDRGIMGGNKEDSWQYFEDGIEATFDMDNGVLTIKCDNSDLMNANDIDESYKFHLTSMKNKNEYFAEYEIDKVEGEPLTYRIIDFDKDSFLSALSDPYFAYWNLSLNSEGSSTGTSSDQKDFPFISNDNDGGVARFDIEQGLIVLKEKFQDTDYSRAFLNVGKKDKFDLSTLKTGFTGGIVVKSGNPNFEYIKLVNNKNSKYKVTLENGETAFVGIYTDSNGVKYKNRNSADVKVHNVYVEGFDYGCLSNNGLICGLHNVIFKNNKVGYCLDTDWFESYSDNSDTTFINNDVAIEIIEFSGFTSPYQLAFRNIYFYNDKENFADYKIHTNDKYYFLDNYYGIDSSIGLTNNNVRSANVVYVGNSIAKVATNPCLRYPESPISLGIDPKEGLFTQIFSGSHMLLNANDILNLAKNQQMDIGISNPSNGVEMGKLTVKGGEK